MEEKVIGPWDTNMSEWESLTKEQLLEVLEHKMTSIVYLSSRLKSASDMLTRLNFVEASTIKADEIIFNWVRKG